MTAKDHGTLELQTQLADLRQAYDGHIAGEARRLAGDLQRMARRWATLPDQRRPDTIPAIFGRTYDENFLSTYLAYVLDPARNGLGSEPLRRLLALAGADVAGMAFESVVIDREYFLDRYGRIDLLVRINEQILLGVENKVLASEAGNQTRSYAEGLPRRFPDYKHYYLFLTRDGHEGSSRQFVPLSYRQLHEALAAIPLDGLGDGRQRALWADFLEHVRVYIALGEEGIMELSDKAKLYVANYKMIKDLTQTFTREADEVFTYFQNTLAAGLSADAWQMWFSAGRPYQYFQRPAWEQPHLWVYYQYQTSRQMLIQDSFAFMVDVFRKDAGRFFNLFQPRLDLLRDRFDQLGLTYRPYNRPQALAWKTYPLDGDPDHIVAQLARAYDEFAFLTPHIDATLAEMEGNDR